MDVTERIGKLEIAMRNLEIKNNELEKTLEESENIKINQTDFFAKTLCSDCSGCN